MCSHLPKVTWLRGAKLGLEFSSVVSEPLTTISVCLHIKTHTFDKTLKKKINIKSVNKQTLHTSPPHIEKGEVRASFKSLLAKKNVIALYFV